MTQATKWLRENAYKLEHDYPFIVELPLTFKDGSAVVVHENGVAVTTIPDFSEHGYGHRFLLDELISWLKRKLGTNKERTSN